MIDPAVARFIDQTVAGLQRRRFLQDPILGSKQSRLHSIFASVGKRHGLIIEKALRESLLKSPNYEVWSEPKFSVSRAADDATAQSVQRCLATSMPYPITDAGRSLQLDVLAFDRNRNFLGSYEIKRGNGPNDSGKQRQIRRDLLATHVLLKSYGVSRQIPVEHARAYVVFYYGRGSLGKDAAQLTLTGRQLDDHFRWSVRADIEAANNYYRDRLTALLEGAEHDTDVERQLNLLLPISRTGT
jgi:hypothetical protein